MNLTYFNLNFTYLNLNLTYFNFNLTHFNLNFAHYNLKFTYLNLRLKRCSTAPLQGKIYYSKRIYIFYFFWDFIFRFTFRIVIFFWIFNVPFHWNFNSILRRDHQKNFLWASRLWIGRRREPILGYVPKNDEKKNLVHKGFIQRTLNINLQYYVNSANSLHLSSVLR